MYRGSEFEIQQDAFRDNLHFFLIGSRSWTLTNAAGVDLGERVSMTHGRHSNQQRRVRGQRRL
jgi:hypothetical protein